MFLVLNVLLFSNFIYLIYADSGTISNKENLSLLGIIESGMNVNDFCLICIVI